MSEGWIPWDGSAGLPRSIDRCDIVDMRFRDGHEGHNRRAVEWNWLHFGAPYDIIAYRLSRDAPDVKAAAQDAVEQFKRRALASPDGKVIIGSKEIVATLDRIVALEAENFFLREALIYAESLCERHTSLVGFAHSPPDKAELQDRLDAIRAHIGAALTTTQEAK